MKEPVIWCEKYRPKTIEDCILPPELKAKFQAMVTADKIPNLMLIGPPGMGKTTVAKAMLNETGSEYIEPNGSLEVNMDKIRNDISDFASARSFNGKRKFVFIDEADRLTEQVQDALRNFTETFSGNCGFIFTLNHHHKMLPAMDSRFAVIDFRLSKAQKNEMAGQFYKRVLGILKAEGVKYDVGAVQEVMVRYLSDYRKIINELQTYSATGAIDSGILAGFGNVSYKQLITAIKAKDFTNIRKWVGEHPEQSTFYTDFYRYAKDVLDPVNLASLIMILGKYSYQHNISTDPEINITACLVETMLEVEFK